MTLNSQRGWVFILHTSCAHQSIIHPRRVISKLPFHSLPPIPPNEHVNSLSLSREKRPKHGEITYHCATLPSFSNLTARPTCCATTITITSKKTCASRRIIPRTACVLVVYPNGASTLAQFHRAQLTTEARAERLPVGDRCLAVRISRWKKRRLQNQKKRG